jgi:hypothetical protein
MKVKFITCIYSNLHGTDFGGRPSRGGHYRWSLLSLLNMTNADFVCYTSSSEIEDLRQFFYERHKVDTNRLDIKVFELKNSVFFEKLNELKQKKIHEFRSWDRCLEIQYNKFYWFDLEDKSYDYYYWIDAGISHSGLLPNKWLESDKGYDAKFFTTSIFNNIFLDNLIKFTNDKIFIIAKDNVRNYWSGTVDEKYYIDYNMDYHIIGGIFGGKKDNFDIFIQQFKNYLEIFLNDGITPMEENILSLMNVNHSDMFNRKFFDVWWCPDNAPQGVSDDFFEKNKSFYKVIEELINNE